MSNQQKRQPTIRLTSKDLDDIKRAVEEPGVEISWITSEDDNSPSDYFHHEQIVQEEIIHFDNGSGHHIDDVKELKDKWCYNIIRIHNAHPKITLRDVGMDIHYTHTWHTPSALGYYEFPPQAGKPSEYTIKKTRDWIDKNLTTLEQFRKFRFQHDAIQITKDERESPKHKPKLRVTTEYIKLAKALKPKQTIYLILHSYGWSNSVTTHGSYGTPKKEEKLEDKGQKHWDKLRKAVNATADPIKGLAEKVEQERRRKIKETRNKKEDVTES